MQLANWIHTDKQIFLEKVLILFSQIGHKWISPLNTPRLQIPYWLQLLHWTHVLLNCFASFYNLSTSNLFYWLAEIVVKGLLDPTVSIRVASVRCIGHLLFTDLTLDGSSVFMKVFCILSEDVEPLGSIASQSLIDILLKWGPKNCNHILSKQSGRKLQQRKHDNRAFDKSIKKLNSWLISRETMKETKSDCRITDLKEIVPFMLTLVEPHKIASRESCHKENPPKQKNAINSMIKQNESTVTFILLLGLCKILVLQQKLSINDQEIFISESDTRKIVCHLLLLRHDSVMMKKSLLLYMVYTCMSKFLKQFNNCVILIQIALASIKTYNSTKKLSNQSYFSLHLCD
jgi:hypothetical protein